MKKRILPLLMALLLCLALPARAEVHFEGAKFDGQALGVRVSVSAEETPVYLVLEDITLNDTPFDLGGTDFADMWLGYADESHSTTGVFIVKLQEGFVNAAREERAAAFEAFQRTLEQSGLRKLSFRVTVIAPKQQIAEVDTTFHGNSAAIWQEIDEIVARGDTPVETDEPHTALVPSWAFSSVAPDEPVAIPQEDASVLIEHANMRVVEQRVIEVTGSSWYEKGEVVL